MLVDDRSLTWDLATVLDRATWSAPLERVLADRSQPRLVFQPIVDLQRALIVGYEALARFDGPPYEPPDRWFSAASRLGVGPQLEARVVRAARAALPTLPPNCFLTVNISPHVLCTPAVEAVMEVPGSLVPLVLELTEQSEVVDQEGVRRALNRYRSRGLLVALDDAGDGYAGLGRLLSLRPQLVKLDRSLTQDADHDEAQRALAQMVGNLASRLDAWLLVEGIERPRQLEAYVRLGVPLGQGNLLGAAGPRWPTLNPAVADLIRSTAVRRSTGTDEVLGLIERAPAIPSASAGTCGADLFLDEPDADVAVVVDDGDRPVGLLARDDALARRPWNPIIQRAAPASGVAELAVRSMTRPLPSRYDPSVCCDETGRYLGIVRVERLVEQLAQRAAPCQRSLADAGSARR